MKLFAAVLVSVLSVGWVKRADSAANSALLCSTFDRSLIGCGWIFKILL